MHDSKKNDRIIERLYSHNQNTILDTLSEIRETGSSLIVPALIELMVNSEFGEVKTEARSIIAELKDEGSKEVLIQAIGNERYRLIRQELISLCWENGLDYTPYFEFFVDLVLEGDYMESFEAMTVVENLEGTLPKETSTRIIEKLQRAFPGAKEEKVGYIQELIQIARDLSNEVQ